MVLSRWNYAQTIAKCFLYSGQILCLQYLHVIPSTGTRPLFVFIFSPISCCDDINKLPKISYRIRGALFIALLMQWITEQFVCNKSSHRDKNKSINDIICHNFTQNAFFPIGTPDLLVFMITWARRATKKISTSINMTKHKYLSINYGLITDFPRLKQPTESISNEILVNHNERHISCLWIDDHH